MSLNETALVVSGSGILFFLAAVYLIYYIWAKHIEQRAGLIEAQTRYHPKVTVVIATHNEERVIGRKLEDVYGQGFESKDPKVLVVDDCSTDGTLGIVEAFKDNHPESNIDIISQPKRMGKSHAVNLALSTLSADSEIVIFTDADVTLGKGALTQLLSNFQDETVGGACGRQILVNCGETYSTEMESAYRRVYNTLRVAESNADSTPIFHGELSAFRAKIVRDERIPEDANADDSALAITVRRRGYRAVYDPKAVFYEIAPPDRRSQDAQKTRRAQGLVRLFWRSRDMLLKSRYGAFGRWILPMNFVMHILSPLMIVLSIVLLGAGVSVSINMNPDWRIAYTIYLFLVLTVIIIGASWIAGFRIMLTLVTFLSYQYFLLKAILLALFRIKLYKWQTIPSVRR